MSQRDFVTDAIFLVSHNRGECTAEKAVCVGNASGYCGKGHFQCIYGVGHDRVVDPLMFAEKTNTGAVYLDMLQLYVFRRH